MYRALKLERLLIYSDIYGLGLTDADISHCQTMFTAYKGMANMEYVYKPATAGYDLVLNFTVSDKEPYLNLDEHNSMLDTVGYPVIRMNFAYLKFLPPGVDLKFVEEMTEFINHNRGNGHNSNKVFQNIAQLKKQIIDTELPSYVPDYYHPMSEDMVKMLYRCADKTPPVFGLKKKDYDEVPDYINHIVGVLQLPDDTRIAFYVGKKSKQYYYNQGYDLSFSFYTVKVGEPAYNWTDPGRYCSHQDSETKIPRVFYIDEHPILPKDKDVVDTYRRGQGVVTLDNTTLDTLVKRWMRKQQDLANEQAAIKALEKKIKDKIDQLIGGGEFAYNDVTFRKNEFEYEGQIISCKAVEIKDILTKFSGQYSEDHLNFDRVMDVWMNELYKVATKSATPVIAHIGDVEVKLEHTAKKAKDGVISHVYRINDHRVNKDEVQQIIGRAICFPNTEAFEEFCDTVSSCSLKYHSFLAGGICVNVHDEIFGQKMEFKISLERKKNKNYIVFNGKRLKVGDTNKLLTVLHARGMSRVIDILLDEKIAGMSGEDIKQLMTTGRQLLLDQRQREEELLKSTMSMFNIEKIDEFKAQNGRLLDGYLVKGTIRNYVVEEKKLLVYEYPSGRYICMVDKGQNEHTNTARLVNRFFALSNDSRLAKEISTL